ncbi:hypothetical protein LXL04_037225 [Taraxacum kok-saghyz]
MGPIENSEENECPSNHEKQKDWIEAEICSLIHIRTAKGCRFDQPVNEEHGKGVWQEVAFEIFDRLCILQAVEGQVLGKSKMILRLLEGLPTMLKGKFLLKMKPELHYGEDDCPVSASDSFPKDAKLNFEIELIGFSKVKIVTEDFGVLKKAVHEAQSWENPRDIYEVNAMISAKLGNGQQLQLHKNNEPILFTFGKSETSYSIDFHIYIGTTYYLVTTCWPRNGGFVKEKRNFTNLFRLWLLQTFGLVLAAIYIEYMSKAL